MRLDILPGRGDSVRRCRLGVLKAVSGLVMNSDFPDDTRTALAFLQRTAGEVETTVHGVSMVPAIPNGSSIRVRSGDAEACRAGNIVAFAGGGGWVVHRVVYCGRRGSAQQYILTLGDGRTVPDPPVVRAAVAGIVTAVRVGDAWLPPPPPRPLSPLSRVLVGLLRTLLEISPRLACALAGAARFLRRAYLGARRRVRRLFARSQP